MMSPITEFEVFGSVPREAWANAENRVFSGWKQGRKTQYRPAARTSQLCLEVHKPPSDNGVIEVSPITNSGKIDRDKVLPFDVVTCFLHKSSMDVMRYINGEGRINHLCGSPTCGNVCHLAIDPSIVVEDRKKCYGKVHTYKHNPSKQCPHMPKCYFPFPD